MNTTYDHDVCEVAEISEVGKWKSRLVSYLYNKSVDSVHEILGIYIGII